MRLRSFVKFGLLGLAGVFPTLSGCGSTGGEPFLARQPDASAGGAGATGDSGAASGGASGGGGLSTGATGGGSGAAGGATGGAGAGGVSPGDSGPGGVDGGCPDADQDLQTTCAGDCDDADPTNFTGNVEACGDAKDNNCNNQADEGCGGIGTFVSALAGDDANPGTQALPVATIAKGLANASVIGGGADVYVADGTYAEDVTVVEGVSLLGGYSCGALPCTWARAATACKTILRPQAAEGIAVGAAITRATSIDGFRIEGKMGGNGPRFGRSAITIEGGSPILRNDCIYGPESNGGDWKMGRTNAVTIIAPTTDPAGGLIEGNQIYGGKQTVGNASTALAFDWYTAGASVAVVRKNLIVGGESSGNVAGLSHWSVGLGTLIEDNDISGGKSTGTGTAWATNGGGTLTFSRNRINADPAHQTECAVTGTDAASGLRLWCGGMDSQSSKAVIQNNVVFGAKAPNSVGIRLGEFETPAGLVILNGNTVMGHPPGGGSLDYATALVLTIGPCAGCGFVAEVGSTRNNVFLTEHGAHRFSVFEDAPSTKTQEPLAFENNLLYVPGLTGNDALYREWGGTTATLLTTVSAVNGMTTLSGVVKSNVSADPMLDATQHLGSGSPAINAGSATEAPSTDMDGDSRPKGSQIDIGADEAG